MLEQIRFFGPVEKIPPTGGNHILRALPPADLRLLTPHLRFIELKARQVLERPGGGIETIVFPDTGIMSVVAHGRSGRQIEAGLIGFEGLTGVAVVMGDDRSASETSVQVAGRGWTLPADILRQAMAASPSLRAVLLRYVETLMIQTAHTALAHGRGTIDERLARWLLMAQDRLGGSQLPLTHDLLSLMLGVRRPSVTDALHRLEGDAVIRARRGMIEVRDRAALEAAAGCGYGGPEREYRRLLGGWPASGGEPWVGPV